MTNDSKASYNIYFGNDLKKINKKKRNSLKYISSIKDGKMFTLIFKY